MTLTRSAIGLALLALLSGCATRTTLQADAPDDYAVYATVIRAHLVRPAQGEHGLLCDPEEPATQLAIDGRTRPLWTHTARRDSAAAAELPPRFAPMVAALRATDSLARRTLAAESLVVGIPVRLESDALANSGAGLSDRPASVIRLSPVAYSADGERALVFATRACREQPAGEVEEGAYRMALLVPVERRGEQWVVLDPVHLELDPR